jgi:hypothetical protein
MCGPKENGLSHLLLLPKQQLLVFFLCLVDTILLFLLFYVKVAIHIYKLNYIVATINDQLERHYSPEMANQLINILGIMLPFGFVVLPIVATMLHTQPMVALQVANVVGFLYGGVMTYVPNMYWLQIGIVFPAVATSRQLVYSTLFHTIGQVFGFANYGVLLGLTNAIASLFQTLQTPMVEWSETVNSYFWSNFVLWVATVPLFVFVLYSDPTWRPGRKNPRRRLPTNRNNNSDNNDTTASQQQQRQQQKSNSVSINEGTSLLFSATVGEGYDEETTITQVTTSSTTVSNRRY